MGFSLRRIFLSFLFVMAFLGFGSSLEAYPVSITINVTFVDIPGQSDPLGLGNANPPLTATITTTIDSSTPMASYPATVFLTLPAVGLTNSEQTGTLTITSGGQITASFSAPASGSFNATLQLEGVTFPSPVPSSFGNASFSSPASSVHYTLLGQSGVVGVTGTVSAVGLTASPASISSTYTVGGSAPAPQTINVGSNDSATPNLSYTVALVGATAPFVTLSSTGGTTPGSVIATFSTSVPAGTYTATIQVNTSNAQGAPISIPVTYTVSQGSGGGSLHVSPSILSFQFFLPGSTTSGSQSISISSSSGATSFTAAVQSGSFLTVSSASNAVPGAVTVTANAASLAAGSYSGSILITAAGTSVSVPVTVTVTSNGGGGGGTGFTVQPTSLHFTYMIGQPPPPAQTLTVSNPIPVSFTVANQTFYLPVTPTSGTTTGSVSVSLNPSGITSAGVLTDDLEIKTAAGVLASIPITVTVEGSVPALVVAPTSLSFSNATGGSLSQTLAVTSAVAATYTVTTTTPWLTVSPASGTAPGSVTVTASPSSLSTGNYTGSVTVTSSVAGAAPVTISVAFSVTQAQQLITVAPTGLAFVYQLGGTAPVAQTVTLTIPAGTTAAVTGVGASWLAVSQSADMTTATVTVATTNLMAGVYTGSLIVSGSAAGSAPIYVPVTLTVSSSGTGIGLSSSSLTFTYQPNGTLPATQTISIAGIAATALTVTSDSAWLTATPSSLTTPGTLTVTAAPGAMSAGVYNGNLTLTSSSGTTTIPVTLDLGQTATPVVAAVSNAISYENATGAPGLIAAVWGTGLGSSGTANPYFSPSGTQVFADGIPCPVLFASAGQVNIVLPYSLAGQTSATIQLFNNGVASNTVTMALQATAPSIFTVNSSGSGGGAILNQDLSVNSATNPAAAGTIVAIYAGGGGQTNPLGVDGQIIPSVGPFPAPAVTGTVSIGGQDATVSYYGDAPALVSGLLQINVTIPVGTPSGPQPVIFSANGIDSQPNVVVYVQ